MEEKCCCSKKKVRSPEEKKRLINRLNRISGQINGLKKMLENDDYCVDILTQSAAASTALDSFERVRLDEHIRTCVADNIRKGNDEVIEELVDILRKMMK